jgi:hypothetical protein
VTFPTPNCVTYAYSTGLFSLNSIPLLTKNAFSNTQERKPVTNSRDTQELPPDAGQEMLRIFHTHPARTSLLQDFAFYEVVSSNNTIWLLSNVTNLLAPVPSEDASPCNIDAGDGN